MKTVKAILGVAAVALITSTAVAGDESKDSKHTAAAKFEKLDTDKDGRLSKDEVRTERTITAQFAAVDQDSDGYLSQTEYSAMLRSDPSSSDSQSDWSDTDHTDHDRTP